MPSSSVANFVPSRSAVAASGASAGKTSRAYLTEAYQKTASALEAGSADLEGGDGES
jgi:hypothetical protein